MVKNCPVKGSYHSPTMMMENFALRTFCPSPPLCNVDLTPFMGQKFEFYYFLTWKGGMGVQEPVFVGFGDDLMFLRIFQDNVSKVVDI